MIVGNPTFVGERGIDLADLDERIGRLERATRTVIAVGRNGRAMGIIALGDRLRGDAVDAVARLHDAGLRTVLLSGDNERVARRIAQEAGIEEVHAGVLPDAKAVMVRRLQAGGRVAMVGDGINDAAALMQADVGIAMGGGTDIAIDSADVIILSNRLDAVASAFETSRRGYRRMLQNVSIAFMFNGIGVPIAATGLLHPIWAMVAMAVSVTLIFANALWAGHGCSSTPS